MNFDDVMVTVLSFEHPFLGRKKMKIIFSVFPPFFLAFFLLSSLALSLALSLSLSLFFFLLYFLLFFYLKSLSTQYVSRLSQVLVKSNEHSLCPQKTYRVGKTDKSKRNFSSLFKCPQLVFFKSSFMREMPNLDLAVSCKQKSEAGFSISQANRSELFLGQETSGTWPQSREHTGLSRPLLFCHLSPNLVTENPVSSRCVCGGEGRGGVQKKIKKILLIQK